MRQLHIQNCRLQSIEAAVDADQAVIEFGCTMPAVIAQLSNELDEVGIARYHDPCVSICPEILGRIETETTQITKCTGTFPSVGGAVCLTCILDNE